MSEMHRREIVQLLAAAPLAAVLDWSSADVVRANQAAARGRRARGGAPFAPQFFTPHEYDTVGVLVDMIIPRDERSGSATDAGVPEFMDFIVLDEARRQTAMRGGLAWIDAQCRKRFGATFLDCADDQRRELLDDIAWPARAPAELSHGVAFFNSFRDLTASGFWSSRMGVADLQYRGNVAIPQWAGCPPEVLNKVGVSYDDVGRER